MKKTLSALGLAALITAVPAGASAEKKEPEPEIAGYIPIQLGSFSVPTDAGDAGFGRGPITMFLVVRGQPNVGILCRYLPRIREAITLLVDQSPVPMRGGRFQLEDIGIRLHDAINRALPKPLVVRLHLVPGVRRMGQDAVDLELPEADPECMAIRELPLDVTAMLKGGRSSARTFVVPDPDGPAPSPPVRTRPRRPRADRAPAPPASTPLGPSITVKRLDGDDTPAAGPDGADCVDVTGLWSTSTHQISGKRYWLSRVFTLDDDNDGSVDNVGFLLKAAETPDLYIYYFPGQGRQSVITAPTLRLSDDRLVPDLCHGQVEFDAPLQRTDADAGMPDQAVAQAPESSRDDQAATAGQPPQADKRGLVSGPGLFFSVAIGAGALLIGGGIVGYVIARRRRRERRRRRDRRAAADRRGPERRQKNAPAPDTERRTGSERRDEKKERRTASDRRDEPDRRETQSADPAPESSEPDTGAKPDKPKAETQTPDGAG